MEALGPTARKQSDVPMNQRSRLVCEPRPLRPNADGANAHLWHTMAAAPATTRARSTRIETFNILQNSGRRLLLPLIREWVHGPQRDGLSVALGVLE